MKPKPPRKYLKSLLGLFVFFAGLALAGRAEAATLYMPDQCANLQTCFSTMQGGDTLIIRDGTYTGAVNTINDDQHPPAGSSSAYTIIKAEHDGEVYFDGESVRSMFVFMKNQGVHPARYWRFEGLVWRNGDETNVIIDASSYVKFLRCGAYNAAPGPNVNFSTGSDAWYILFEGCYAYGANGRYKFIAGTGSHYIIFRNCVTRYDGGNMGNEVVANYSDYGATHVLYQNCISVDSDSAALAHTTGYDPGDDYGCWTFPTTSGPVTDAQVESSICLNNKFGGLGVGVIANDYDVTFHNFVMWDIATPPDSRSQLLVLGRANSGCSMQNSTIGVLRNSERSVEAWPSGMAWTKETYPDNEFYLGSNIFYDLNGRVLDYTIAGMYAPWNLSQFDYNAYYSPTCAGYISSCTTCSDCGNQAMNSHDRIANPIWNASANPTGALKYITRIEPSSNMSGQGQNGSDIGANPQHLYGAPGTLWGESGYNQNTGVSMWPFPNEDLIKTKMAAYSGGGVSGARGFAASGNDAWGQPLTLTRYIWQYLGNEIPCDVYGTCEEDMLAPANPAGLSVR